MWRLLWMPPSLGYYTLDGPFAVPELASVTKRLVFSAWHMVPRAVASLVSYEAERRMMRAAHPRARLTQEDWKKQRGLLRFGISDERLTGLPLLLLVYPCLTFARDCDPRELARGDRLTAAQVRAQLAARITALIEKLGIVHETGSNTDDRWYWLAPMLLDYAEFPGASQTWWDRADLAQTWAGVEAGDEDEGWTRHVELARQAIGAIRGGKEQLGMPPDDLIEVRDSQPPPPRRLPRCAPTHAQAGVIQQRSLLCDIAARSGRAFLRFSTMRKSSKLFARNFVVNLIGSVCWNMLMRAGSRP